MLTPDCATVAIRLRFSQTASDASVRKVDNFNLRYEEVVDGNPGEETADFPCPDVYGEMNLLERSFVFLSFTTP